MQVTDNASQSIALADFKVKATYQELRAARRAQDSDRIVAAIDRIDYWLDYRLENMLEKAAA